MTGDGPEPVGGGGGRAGSNGGDAGGGGGDGDGDSDLRPAPLREAVARRGSLLRTVRAVGWSFFGVRRSAEHEKDVANLNPLHVILVGLAGAALFVVVLVLLVRWVVGSGVAG